MILENLDIMLSFTAVMLLFSLLITVAVQGLVALVNLRGWVLGVGVERLLKQVDPAFETNAKSTLQCVHVAGEK